MVGSKDGDVSDATAPDDRELVARCVAGDQAAFESLVRRRQGKVQRLVTRYLGRDDAAVDDMTQEVFVKAYYSLGDFHGQSSFRSWLYRITVNQCLDEQKRRRRQEMNLFERLKDAIHPQPTSPLGMPGADASERETGSEKTQAVQQAIHELPIHQRDVIILKELEQLSYQEVAGVLQTSVGTVKSRLARARAELRRKLAPVLSAREGQRR